MTTTPQRRMTDLETLIWRSERQPTQSSTVALLEGAPEWKRLRAVHERATRLIPGMRERVLEPAVPVGPPAWIPDDDFDLDRHLRRARLPAPGSPAQLLAFAEEAATAPLDRDRPLWEGTLVEGLPHGRAAYVLKAHRSLSGRPGDLPRAETIPPDARSLALADVARQALTLPLATGRLLTTGAHALTHPGAAAASTLRLAVSLRRAASTPVAGSPLFHGRTGVSWRFGLLECPLDDLRAAAHAAGGSVTDAYLAALLGGIRRYHERHGIELDEMPVSLPRDPGGWVGSVFAAPVGVCDLAERIASLRGITMTLRVDSAQDGLAALAPVLNRFPSGVGAAACRITAGADLSATNRIGTPRPAYLAGARVERVYPLGPVPGSAVSAAIVSQGGTCCLGLTMDGSVVPDPDVLVECVRAGLEEVLTLG
ncbi:WS/DGAT domain-containing protein [Actinoplanes sp. KI2]|uniref:wax ester/triacylglycerol synthase domain-containing protein n=1 Tax=Actinoplanes sp. KI2 TaxID=2983315 RepID=UPI0021D5D32A|nr:wax ester/triacylglycerol synthase domain-containing protein [Actinoplanes sp. KI2]MCU7729471.1 WS/DGAT domain-containing protein [Actinoplanes sp. KI2]